MKQVTITDEILQKLKAAAGDDFDASKVAVYRAVAINSRPVRKKHPLYEGAVHPRQFLSEMASRVQAESIPLQLMHSMETLPIGRVFSGEVVDQPGFSELQVLFWVDRTHEKEISLIDSGTVDQVSVSILAKHAISNKSGFDFFGPDATFEHIWSGTDPDGNVMGQDGAHVIMQGLDSWFEMSLVGQGGIPGARILGNGDLKLAASGQQVPLMTLTLSSSQVQQEMSTMDLSALVDQLSTAKADLTVKSEKLTAAEAEIATLKARVQELEAAQPSDAALTEANEKLEAANAQLAEVKSTVETLTAGLTDAAKQIFAVCGDVDPQLPEDATQLASALVEKVKTVKLAPGGAALNASAGSGEPKVSAPSTSAFKRR